MPVGVGIVGTGWGLKTQLPIFRRAGLEVVALYSRDRSRGKALCEKHGIRLAFHSVSELCACPDVDVASVVSPTHLHAEHVLTALRAGKHLLSEKPGGANVAEVEAMLAEARARPRQIAIIDHQLRFTKALQAARRAIFEDRALGQLRHVDLHFLRHFAHFGSAHVWWNEKEKGGGALGALGVHAIDLLHFATGEKICSLQSSLETFVKEKPRAAKTGQVMVACTAEEYIATQFRLEGGAVGSMVISGVTNARRRMVTFVGSAGSAILDFDDNSFVLRDGAGNLALEVSDDRVEGTGEERDLTDAFAIGTFSLASAMKVAVELGSRELLRPACTIEDSLYNQRVIASIHNSNEGRQWARL